MNSINWRRFAYGSLYFIQMQTFLTLIFFPIVIAWGLPVSLCAPVSNILFGPILTLFLLMSSLIFFAEIFYIPNSWLVCILEQVSNMWLWILNWELKFLCIGFVKPPDWVLWGIALCAFLIMQVRYKNWLATTALLLVTFLVSAGVILKLTSSGDAQVICIARDRREVSAAFGENVMGGHAHEGKAEHVPEGAGEAKPEHAVEHISKRACVYCIGVSGKTIVIDPGVIGKNMSAPSWVSYTLMPEIIKNTGCLTIDHLILLQINGALFEALTALCTKMTIKKVYMPYWSGRISGGAWRKFYQFRRALHASGGQLIRLRPDQKSGEHDNEHEKNGGNEKKSEHENQEQQDREHIIESELRLVLKPLGQQLLYQEVTYPAFCVSGDSAGQQIFIAPVKYKVS